MLYDEDENENVHRIAFNKIQCIRKNSYCQCQIIKYQDSEASSSQVMAVPE